MYRNHEGYPDPTAGQALANIIREERAKRKAVFIKKYPKTDTHNSNAPRRRRPLREVSECIFRKS